MEHVFRLPMVEETLAVEKQVRIPVNDNIDYYSKCALQKVDDDEEAVNNKRF